MHNHDSQRDTVKEGSSGTGAGQKTTGKTCLNAALVDVHQEHREAVGCRNVIRLRAVDALSYLGLP